MEIGWRVQGWGCVVLEGKKFRISFLSNSLNRLTYFNETCTKRCTWDVKVNLSVKGDRMCSLVLGVEAEAPRHALQWKVTVMSCLTIWSTVAVFVTVTRTHSPYATLIDGITDSGGQELSGTPCNLQPLLPLYTCATYSRPLTRDDASMYTRFF